MKKNTLIKTIFVSLIALTSLSSCALIDIIGGLIDEPETPSEYTYNSNLRRDDSLVKVEGKAGENTTISAFKSKEGYEVFPSVGNNNLLVIPVYFSDFTVEDTLNVTKEEARQNIYNNFFGTSYDDESNEETRTGWESVSSFYKKSSYGKLNISGMVTDWYAYPKTLLEAATDTKYQDATNPILESAVEWFKINYPDEVKNYDLDKDGYLDGVVLIYANDYATSNSTTYSNYAITKSNLQKVNELCWAFVTWDKTNTPSIVSPNGNVYMWASYDFMWDGGYQTGTLFEKHRLVDAHTYIHEFGHMMGLDDYYSYDSDNTSPVGSLDMMDSNIGDHNAYSKYLLGWYEPTLIEKEGTYTISSLSSSEEGTSLLIPASLDDYGYSAFNEYIIIEFYTPTGNNYMDANNKYMGKSSGYPYMFTKYGVRMFHVDSRLIIFNNNNYTYQFAQSLKDMDTSFEGTIIAMSNTASYSIDNNSRLISLISKRGVKDYFSKAPLYAGNSDLYYEGDKLTSLSFHSGTSLGYKVEVSSIDETNLTAQITISAKS